MTCHVPYVKTALTLPSLTVERTGCVSCVIYPAILDKTAQRADVLLFLVSRETEWSAYRGGQRRSGERTSHPGRHRH